jgi:hypothetical protein
MKRTAMVAAIALVGGFLLLAGPAQATDHPETCTAEVIDQPAYDEQVKVIDTAAQDAIPGQWWNFAPNHGQGPLEGTPAFPADERGTWEGPHTDGGPDGEGTYQAGDGHGSWFHREPGTPAVEEVSHVETVHHDATYKTVEVPCDNPPKPEPVVQSDSTDECVDADTVKVTTTTTTWDWTLVDGEWVKDAEPTISEVVTTRPAVDDECFVATPPTYITVAAPVIHQPTCEAPKPTVDFVTEGEHYDGYVVWPPFSSAPNVVDVIAFAHDGYEIKGDAYWELTIVPLDEDECDEAPAPTPPADVDRPLPDTGGVPLGLLLAGVGTALAGFGLLVRARRA